MPAISNQFHTAAALLPCAVMSMVSESSACTNAVDDIDTPQQWPQCHRIDASPSRFMQDGFASLLNCWLRHMEHADRLACVHRMGHLSNFQLDILSVLGVHSMTFGIARMHSLIAYFVDYIRIDPQIDVDGMLENRKRSLAGFRMAGKYLAVIQPFSALLANPKFRNWPTSGPTACPHPHRQGWHAARQPAGAASSHARATTASPKHASWRMCASFRIARKVRPRAPTLRIAASQSLVSTIKSAAWSRFFRRVLSTCLRPARTQVLPCTGALASVFAESPVLSAPLRPAA